MKERFRRQHIVPQSYLKRFAIKQEEPYMMGTRLNSNAQRDITFFLCPVKKVAYMDNYYDTHEREDIKYWEHFFDKKFDVLCGKPLSRIISKITLSHSKSNILSDMEKSSLSKIIMSQAIRVPIFLDSQIAQAEYKLQSYKQDILDNFPIAFETERNRVEGITFDYETRKDIILDGMFSEERFDRFCSVLQSKVWIVFYNNLKHIMPFVTSDNPVIFTDIKGHEEVMTSIGIANEKAIIYFPLSPSILVGIFSPTLFFETSEKYDNQIIEIDDYKFIGNINLHIVQQSYMQSFFPEPLYSFISSTEPKI